MHRRRRNLCLTLLLLAGSVLAAGPASSIAGLKLLASDGEQLDRFGSSVAIDGDTLVVGADGENFTRGAVYVFVRNGAAWTEQAKLVGGEANVRNFGLSVAVSGDTVLVGAPSATVGGVHTAYLFVRSGTTWSQQAKFPGNSQIQTGSGQGYSVAIDGDTALVGEVEGLHPEDPSLVTGAVHVFVRTGTTWALQATLGPSTPVELGRFGSSVALEGETALVGSEGADSAYVFVRNGAVWTEQDQLPNPDPPQPGLTDSFGASIALSGETALIGASFDDGGKGSAYAFVRTGTTWAEQEHLVASDTGNNQYVVGVGTSVALHGDTAVVGTKTGLTCCEQGRVYVFVRGGASGAWTEQATLAASDGHTFDRFGTEVAIEAETALVGAFGKGPPNSVGAAYAYPLSGGSVIPIQGVRNPVPRSDGQSGHALVTGKNLVVRSYARVPEGSGGPHPAMGELCIDGEVATCPPARRFTSSGEVLEFGTELPEADRRNALDSIDFFIRGNDVALLTPGEHTFNVKITGAFPPIEQSFSALFNVSDELDVYIYPISLQDASATNVPPDNTLLSTASDFTRATYPTAELAVANFTRAGEVFPGMPDATPTVRDDAERSLALHVWRKLQLERAPGAREHRFGAAVLPSSVNGANPVGVLGFTFRALQGAVVTIDRDANGVAVVGSTIAHEVGHQLMFGDEYCLAPNVFPCAPNGSTWRVSNPPPFTAQQGNTTGNFVLPGVDAYDVSPTLPGRKALFHEGAVSLYSYMGAGHDNNSWTTPTEYGFLYQNITLAPSAPLLEPRGVTERTVICVSGRIHQNGTVNLDPPLVFETNGEVTPPLPGAGYSIDFLDGSDQVLDSADFDISFLLETLAGPESGVTEEDEVPFGFCIDLPVGTQTMRLRKGATSLAEVEKSANPPSVAFTGATEQSGNVIEAAWMGTDLDGDDLTYNLLYSPNGVSLQPLAIDLGTTSFSLDLDALTPRTLGAFLRVWASDGFNVAEDSIGIEPTIATLDVDAIGGVQELTDGLLILRHLFGFSGETLTTGAVGLFCGRCTPGDVTGYLTSIEAELDADGNGSLEPLTDGLLIVRFLFGFTGATLVNGAVGGDCTRCTAPEITDHLNGLM